VPADIEGSDSRRKELAVCAKFLLARLLSTEMRARNPCVNTRFLSSRSGIALELIDQHWRRGETEGLSVEMTPGSGEGLGEQA
jgi:hypothetical protein